VGRTGLVLAHRQDLTEARVGWKGAAAVKIAVSRDEQERTFFPVTKRPAFREGPIDGVVVRPLPQHEDARGWLIELYREDELDPACHPVMAYVSQTLPGVARGPHEHREQTDCFALVGPGDFKLYLWDARPDSPSFGHKYVLLAGAANRVLVTVPPGVVHAYRNVGQVPGWVFNAPNRLYAGRGKQGPVDEIRYENLPESPFQVDDP
jgi:dTDP-4-dehydrorhamnose 3,5-epimerase